MQLGGCPCLPESTPTVCKLDFNPLLLPGCRASPQRLRPGVFLCWLDPSSTLSARQTFCRFCRPVRNKPVPRPPKVLQQGSDLEQLLRQVCLYWHCVACCVHHRETGCQLVTKIHMVDYKSACMSIHAGQVMTALCMLFSGIAKAAGILSGALQ